MHVDNSVEGIGLLSYGGAGGGYPGVEVVSALGAEWWAAGLGQPQTSRSNHDSGRGLLGNAHGSWPRLPSNEHNHGRDAKANNEERYNMQRRQYFQASGKFIRQLPTRSDAQSAPRALGHRPSRQPLTSAGAFSAHPSQSRTGCGSPYRSSLSLWLEQFRLCMFQKRPQEKKKEKKQTEHKRGMK